jgi:hypothetical protein
VTDTGPLRTARLAVFGATRPLRWLRDYFRTSAEQIEPAEADRRVVVPPDVAEEPGATEHTEPANED